MNATPLWPGPAGKLRGATLDTVGAVTAAFTDADWAQVEQQHLDIIASPMFDRLETLGIDMDEDPIAVFCHLWLAARDCRLRSKKAASALAVAR